jgi:hypothetical protein
MKYHAKDRFLIECGGNAFRRRPVVSRGPTPVIFIFTRRKHDDTDMKPSSILPQIRRMKGTKSIDSSIESVYMSDAPIS